MKILDVDNISIPSINKKYGYDSKSGRMYTTPKYKAFKTLIESAVIQYGKRPMAQPPYSVKVEVSTALDIDNFIKPLMDGMQKSGIINDDANVHELIIRKTPVKKGTPNSLKIYLNEV